LLFSPSLPRFWLRIAWLQSGGLKQHEMFSAVTPEEAVQALMSEIQAHNYEQAYASLDRSSDTDLASFTRELAGATAACGPTPRCRPLRFRRCTPMVTRLWCASE
jgi:hypothetical protein